MLHTVYDINPARLNSIIPALQRMADDPAFEEYRERRFERDDPPTPDSSRSITRESTPGPLPQTQGDIDLAELLRQPLSADEIDKAQYRMMGFGGHSRYLDEVRQERERIDRAWGARDENYVPLYRGPDLMGRAGLQRQNVMIRHSIKKRWQQLGVWDPKWGVPTGAFREFGGFVKDDEPNSWPWWHSRDGELLERRAIRRYLQKKACGHETPTPQPFEVDGTADESPITSRPWFMWALEVAVEETRLERDVNREGTYNAARANVKAQWKEKGYWKDSWTNNLPGEHVWRDLPGWKWRHESPSPEPPDPNDMEFTPSEVDVMEAIRPPTPPSPPPPSLYVNRTPSPGAHPVLFLWWESRQNRPPASLTTDDGGDDEDSRPGAAAELTSEKSAQRLIEDNADITPRAAQSRASTRATSRKQQRQPTTRHPQTRLNGRTTCSAALVDVPSPAARKTRQSRKATRVPISPSRISKPSSPRRSLRIAEREGRLKGVGAPSEAMEVMNKDDEAPQPQLNQHCWSRRSQRG
ncbi:hypothetical protein A1O3_10099 [Capronia epimyces CBS 606.96]|uniref:Uncharacterized protein n=1 Tax=Capronia epimyces CBS 606.96 TaxID=1182542 RepID=W9X904_9EURO|nr:uncharacterized protein A1O3_10099 [Capronia epimyces CBS 606.96]EXJ76942.1 hypothetical protein A1O3_10099 [Capronia epimyces CBS 606.96]